MTAFGLGNQGSNVAQAQPNIEHSTAWIAASDGDLQLLQRSMASLNLNVSAADDNGYTLLHAAASYCRIAIMNFLLDGGAPIDATDNDGDTPLHHVDVVEAAKLLINRGADPTKSNNEGKTALELKRQDLEELMKEEEDDDNDEEISKLRTLIGFLETHTTKR